MGLDKIRKWLVYTVYHFLVYMQSAPQTAVCIYATTGALRATTVVYTDIAVYVGRLHIHQEMEYTSHFLVLSRLQPGGVCIYIYIYGGTIVCSTVESSQALGLTNKTHESIAVSGGRRFESPFELVQV